jgi:hypothetical protein
MIEYIMGQDGYLLRTEWPTYAFDGALMLLVMIGFFLWYPSQLQATGSESLIELYSHRAESEGNDHTTKYSQSPS